MGCSLKGSPPTKLDRFCKVGAGTTVHCPEFRDIRYSGVLNIYTIKWDLSWYMDFVIKHNYVRYWECPLMECLLYFAKSIP